MKKQRIVVPLVLGALVATSSSCAVSPLTRRFMKWGAESCGRSSFIRRLCSGIVMSLTSPVLVVTILVDMPIALIEFFGGTQLVDDPLVRTASIDFDKKIFAGENGESWTAQRQIGDPNVFEVERTRGGEVIERQMVRVLPDRRLEIARALD